MNALNKLRQRDDNLFTVIKVLLKEIGVSVTDTSIGEKLNFHPDFPSLLCIKDVINDFGIKSLAIQRNEEFNLEDFEIPFIASIQMEGWEKPFFTLINNIEENEVNFFHPRELKWVRMNAEEFNKIELGIILLVEKGQNAEETNYKQKRKAELLASVINRSPIFLLIFFAVAGVFLSNSAQRVNPYYLILLGLNLAGIIVSGIILALDMELENPFLMDMCFAGKKVNCSAVLNSKGAKFLSLSWSVIGFSYFFSSFFFQILCGSNHLSVCVLAIISFISVAYICYSVYYQIQIVKQWCTLCLVVQAVLFSQFLIHILNDSLSSWELTSMINYYQFGLIFISVLLITNFIVPTIKKAKTGQQYQKKWLKLKLNRKVFWASLEQQIEIPKLADELGITIGKKDAKYEIIKVCNPYCNPCSKAHPHLESLTEGSNDIRLRIIFTAYNHEADLRAAPVRHFLAIAATKSEVDLKLALNDWYNAPVKDYEKFAAKHVITDNLGQYGSKIEAMQVWCEKMKIRATPTVYVNGYKLTENYRIDELKMILAN